LDNEGPAAALRLASSSLEAATEAHDEAAQVTGLCLVSECELALGKRGDALKNAAQALRLARRCGSAAGEAYSLLAGARATLATDAVVTLSMASEAAKLFEQEGDRQNRAWALLVAADAEADAEKAKTSAKLALTVFEHLGDEKSQVAALQSLMGAEARLAKLAGAGPEAALAAGRQALELARDLGNSKQEASIMIAMAKLDLRVGEGIETAVDAAKIFHSLGCLADAAAASQLAANRMLMTKVPELFPQALGLAMNALSVSKEAENKKSEAIALHTIANCYAAMRDMAKAVENAYEALKAFDAAGDSYGVGLASKLLQGLGQSADDVRSRRRDQQVSFEGLETKKAESPEEEDAKRMRLEEASNMQEERPLWEYAWMPVELQNPKSYGEKFSGTRKIMTSGQLRNQSLLDKLAKSRKGKAAGQDAPRLANLLNGRLQTMPSMQAAMLASQCTAVVYDMTNLNNLGNLEVIDNLLRVSQALLPIEERKVALDIVTESTQALELVAGMREPFHSTVWGFSRAARLENPGHEFRNLDMDAGKHQEQLPVVCRWLLGAQSTRPMEVVVRNGLIQWIRLVGSRTQLRLPVKAEVIKVFE